MGEHVVVSRAGISALIQMAREQHDHHRAIWNFTRDQRLYEGHWFDQGFLSLFRGDYDSATDVVFSSMNESSAGTYQLVERISHSRDLLEDADRQVETTMARLLEVSEAVQVPELVKGYGGLTNLGGIETPGEHRAPVREGSATNTIDRSQTESRPTTSSTTSWRTIVSDISIDLLDPTSTLVATSPSGSNYIDSLRDDCGFVIQGIDWVVRKIRSDWDLIALIFEPISGDFDGVTALAANWRATGHALGSLGANYGALSEAVPHVWEGQSADRAVDRLLEMGQAFDLQRETCAMMAEALDCMLTATQAVCETVAALLSLVDDAVVKLLASFYGWAKEIATGGATVRRIIRLIDQTIGLIKTLDTLVPKIISVLGDLRMLFKAMDVAFGFAAMTTNTTPGHKIDDVAEVGFS